MPQLYLKTRNDLYITSRVNDGTRHLFAQATPDDFSIWEPYLTRGKKLGDPDSMAFFDLVNFKGNPIGLPSYDAVGQQAACPIRTCTIFSIGRGDDHDWTLLTEPQFALTLRQDLANAIFLGRVGAFPMSLQSFRMVDVKNGKVYTEPFSVGSGGNGQPSDPETGRLIVNGLRLIRATDGSLFPWRGFSDFSLFHRFILGQDITPLLDERIALGANILRVFGMYNAEGIGAANGLGALTPDMYATSDVTAFADVLSVRGLRCEWVLFADAMSWTLAEGQTFVDTMTDVLSHDVFTVEVVNEPWKNLPFDVYDLHIPHGWTWASGDYLFDHGPKHGSYVTYHTDRKPEWPRTPRSLAEIRDDAAVAGTHCPVVADEPTGAAELPRGDSRSSTPLDFAYYAACAAQMGAGATFHCDNGIASQLLEPVQKQCAEAFFAALSYVPAEAQFAPYKRGGAGNHNVGDLSVVHHDLEEGIDPAALRSYDKDVPGWGTVFNRIRARGETVMNPGWTKQEEVMLGLGKTTK